MSEEIWVDIECKCKNALAQWVEADLIEDSYSELKCKHDPSDLRIVASFGDDSQIVCKGDDISKIIDFNEHYQSVVAHGDQVLSMAILSDIHNDYEQCAVILKEGRYSVYDSEEHHTQETGTTLKNCGMGHLILSDGRIVFTY